MSDVIDYKHTVGVHTLTGAERGLGHILGDWTPASLLDVGCGPGAWVLAARRRGVTDVVGVDGVVEGGGESSEGERGRMLQRDLSAPLQLDRTFDVAICLEVAEHLDASHAETLVASLCRHSNLVFFSAACPQQFGHHHVNCQWPVYWQLLFNAYGYVCTDAPRDEMWNDEDVEPWYRQNLMRCEKDPLFAGKEPRVLSRIHPSMLPYLTLGSLSEVEDARLPMTWYLRQVGRAAFKKLGRALLRRWNWVRGQPKAD